MNDKNYVLVQNPGTANEDIIGNFYGPGTANDRKKLLQEAYPDIDFDVMKIVDGKLTTEF